METISLRLDNEFLKDLERIMKKKGYSTMTEFIREAMRDKLKELKEEDILARIASLASSSKQKTTDKQLHEAGEKAFAILERKLNK